MSSSWSTSSVLYNLKKWNEKNKENSKDLLQLINAGSPKSSTALSTLQSVCYDCRLKGLMAEDCERHHSLSLPSVSQVQPGGYPSSVWNVTEGIALEDSDMRPRTQGGRENIIAVYFHWHNKNMSLCRPSTHVIISCKFTHQSLHLVSQLVHFACKQWSYVVV